jgi:hypothetical protein
MKNIQKMMLALATSISLFSITEGMEEVGADLAPKGSKSSIKMLHNYETILEQIKELTARIHDEVDKVLADYKRDTAEYHRRMESTRRKTQKSRRLVPSYATDPSSTIPLSMELLQPPSLPFNFQPFQSTSGSFEGNWTESFTLKGETVLHTPQYIQFGGRFFTEITMNNSYSSSHNGHSTGQSTTNLHLSVNSTREKFRKAVKALENLDNFELTVFPFLSPSLSSFALDSRVFPLRSPKPLSTSVPVKGNWTESFRLKNGEIASHTPQGIKFCFFNGSKEINNQGTMIYNGYTLGKFHLKIDSTREEFIAGLKASGLY